MPIKIAGETLNGCSGCEISLLDMGTRLFDLLKFSTIVHLPLIMDNKHSDPVKGKAEVKIPEADVGLISGGIKTMEHIEVAQAMRKACDIVIAFGTCATHGGIPSLANSYRNEDLLEQCFRSVGTDTFDTFPCDRVPKLMDSCTALDEHIHVDFLLPGCPPHPDHIFKILQAIEKGEPFSMPEKSVCDNCPALRSGNGEVKFLKRTLELPAWKNMDDGEKGFKCFLEQGYLCLGPVTRDGCGGDTDKALCITAQVPCRGCFGPIKKEGNQRLALLNALVSNGIDITSLPETISLLRFSGGHGLLRPRPIIKESE